jgi:hypothetical protein
MTKQITQGLGGVTLAVIVAVAALMLFASSAFAAGTLSGDTQTIAAGGTAHVTITGAAASGSGIGNWTVDVTVDAAKLGTAACSPVNPAGDCNVLTGNVVRFSGAAGSDTGLAGAQTFGTVDVTATAALAAGQCSTLTMTISKFQDGAGADLNPTITNGQVCIAAAATNSPTPSASPVVTPKANPVVLPPGGGPLGDSSSNSLSWLLLGAAGLIVIAGGAWTVARARREEN